MGEHGLVHTLIKVSKHKPKHSQWDGGDDGENGVEQRRVHEALQRWRQRDSQKRIDSTTRCVVIGTMLFLHTVIPFLLPMDDRARRWRRLGRGSGAIRAAGAFGTRGCTAARVLLVCGKSRRHGQGKSQSQGRGQSTTNGCLLSSCHSSLQQEREGARKVQARAG